MGGQMGFPFVGMLGASPELKDLSDTIRGRRLPVVRAGFLRLPGVWRADFSA